MENSELVQSLQALTDAIDRLTNRVDDLVMEQESTQRDQYRQLTIANDLILTGQMTTKTLGELKALLVSIYSGAKPSIYLTNVVGQEC